MQTIIAAVAIGILLAIAYRDARTRRIPNMLTAAIVILGLARLILANDLIAAVHTMIATASVFVVAFLLFWRSIFGGGDAKLVAATALLVGSRDLFDFFLIMTVCGGGLGLAILARDRSYAHRKHTSQVATGLPSHWMDPALPPARPTVPYGVAIASAAVVILVLRPVL